MTKLSSLISGIIFGVGLTISGMVNPQKVLGFLNIFDAWDPSLMFVMVGAILIFSPLHFTFKRKSRPIFAKSFILPSKKDVDKNLIIGGLLVGTGTKIGKGCTSGHGVCGISRFSIRSITATISFILTGVITVLIFGI